MKKHYFLFLMLCTYFSQAQIVTFTDAKFKARLLQSSTSNAIAKDLSGFNLKIDTNGDGEIQLTEAANVSEINLNINNSVFADRTTNLSGIENFTNLVRLNTTFQNITNFQISNLPNLKNIINNTSYTEELNVSNLPVLDSLEVGANYQLDLTNLHDLPSIKYIRFSGDRFPANSLNSLPSLEEVQAYGGFNTLETSLNLTFLPNLKIFNGENANFSSLTVPVPNNIEWFSLAGNDLTVFDKTGFIHLEYLDISWNKLHALDVSGISTLELLNCENNGDVFADYNLTSLNVHGCTSLKKLFCMQNLMSVLDLSGLSALETLSCSDCDSPWDFNLNTGLQTIILTGCSNLKVIDCSSNEYLTSLDLSCSTQYTSINIQNCENLEFVNLKNGVVQTTPLSVYGDSAFHALAVDHGEIINVLEAENAVTQSPYYTFTPNCRYYTVTGHVRFDLNGNGCGDDQGIEGIRINFGAEGYTYTDSDGKYTIYTQSPTIALIPVNELYDLFDFGLSGPVTITFSKDGEIATQDFCLAPDGNVKDLEVSLIPLENARPGFDTDYKIVYKNKGNQMLSGSIDLTFQDTVMDYVSATLSIDSQSANHLVWNYSNLLPMETREILFTMNMNTPSEVPPLNSGAVLDFTASILPVAQDQTPIDNSFTLHQTTINSFDPNDKTCLEGQTIPLAKVGDYVNYLIRFENTGTANAENVVVRDEIDASKFDVATLVPVSASHNVYARVTEGNVAEFIFENINLPFDDAHNDGYIAFKIKTKPNLQIGNTFANDAEIYFDYNLPIVTNNYVTTVAALAVNQNGQQKFVVYPNPVKNTLTINGGPEVSNVTIYDASGRIVAAFTNQPNYDISGFQRGVYFVKIYAADKVSINKIIKE